jgi:hypothetical protein
MVESDPLSKRPDLRYGTCEEHAGDLRVKCVQSRLEGIHEESGADRPDLNRSDHHSDRFEDDFVQENQHRGRVKADHTLGYYNVKDHGVVKEDNSDRPDHVIFSRRNDRDQVAGDQVAGDQVAGDQVAGDQVAGDERRRNDRSAGTDDESGLAGGQAGISGVPKSAHGVDDRAGNTGNGHTTEEQNCGKNGGHSGYQGSNCDSSPGYYSMNDHGAVSGNYNSESDWDVNRVQDDHGGFLQVNNQANDRGNSTNHEQGSIDTNQNQGTCVNINDKSRGAHDNKQSATNQSNFTATVWSDVAEANNNEMRRTVMSVSEPRMDVDTNIEAVAASESKMYSKKSVDGVVMSESESQDTLSLDAIWQMKGGMTVFEVLRIFLKCV